MLVFHDLQKTSIVSKVRYYDVGSEHLKFRYMCLDKIYLWAKKVKGLQSLLKMSMKGAFEHMFFSFWIVYRISMIEANQRYYPLCLLRSVAGYSIFSLWYIVIKALTSGHVIALIPCPEEGLINKAKRSIYLANKK